MALAANHPHLAAQEVSSQALPPNAVQTALPDALPEAPSGLQYPDAVVLPGTEKMTQVTMESVTQSKTGSVFILDRDVVVTYGDRTVQADHIEYDSETGDVTATGHMKLTGGTNHEDISASHGTLNIRTQQGRFYDVSGSVGLKTVGHTVEYANSNPFLFTGRLVVKRGPQMYDIYNGTVTSCTLLKPDWLFSAAHFNVDADKARASNSIFHLINIPVLYLPYVTHPVDAEARQSGFLIPVISNSSTKGIVLGEEIYWAINRSMDLTVGTEYYSLRGWSPSAVFRYKGRGNDFAMGRFRALYDRGYYDDGVYVNQGGQDVTFSGRHDFSPETRVVADIEYLSSYVYREAFTANFNDAVSTDIVSTIYGVHAADGFAESFRGDRYQGEKLIPTTTAPGEEVRIFHAPSIDFSATDHALGTTGLLWSMESSAAGLKRTEPGFTSSGIVERFDFHPVLSYRLIGGGWSVLPSVGVRETGYSRSRVTPYVLPNPVESTASINRSDFEASVDIRPPVLERTFDSGRIKKLLRHDVKHTIEPEFTYRYVTGISNFLNVLRFDDIDVASNTNELEYGVTQRLFLRPTKTRDCVTAEGLKPVTRSKTAQGNSEMPPEPKISPCGNREWISWRVAQKRFFNQDFGGAVINGHRNILDTTLNFSGIAFLTEPRAISPLISRLRVRTSEKLDLEWNFDLDTGAKKFTANNFLADIHEGNIFGGVSYARLNAPGRSYSDGLPSSTSDFSQLRVLGGYGAPSKLGFGAAASANFDLKQDSLQYAAVQASYNWDCCGFTAEYRKYELGAVRNEGVERFSFTLKNIGSAGNLNRADRLF